MYYWFLDFFLFSTFTCSFLYGNDVKMMDLWNAFNFLGNLCDRQNVCVSSIALNNRMQWICCDAATICWNSYNFNKLGIREIIALNYINSNSSDWGPQYLKNPEFWEFGNDQYESISIYLINFQWKGIPIP